MKKRSIRALLIISFVITLIPRAGAQKLDALLDTYAVDYRQERLYLHYDKSAYAPGDTVWFKAYLMTDFYPSEDSKTIYVDWVDENGKLLLHTVAPVLEASSNGQFAVPENYTGNTVHVRAYTRWMLNFDSSFLYNKALRVLPKAAPAAAAKAKPATFVQFLPEGGDLVEGLVSKVAFKATDQWGRPVQISGSVSEAGGAPVQTFKTMHHGMGYFFLKPEPGATYTVSWRDDRGEKNTASLPPAKKTGITLTVVPNGTRRNITLERPAAAEPRLQQLYVVGTMFQTKVFSTTADLGARTSISKLIPTASLPTGILTITVFDAAHNAVAERITFIRQDNFAFQPELTVRVSGLNKRGKNQWELTIPDSIAANLSISVTDAALNTDSSENIYSHLLLTNDLKGIVHDPAAYFRKTNDSTAAQLDLVMLTNGWRRFNWEEVARGKRPVMKHARDTSFLSFSGKLYGVPPGRMANEHLVALLKPRDSAVSQMLVVPISGNGAFRQPEFVFFDTLQVFYQFKKGSTLNNASIRFMEDRLAAPLRRAPPRQFSAGLEDTTGLAYHLAAARSRLELKEFLSAKVLANVTVRSRAKSRLEELDKRYASGLFSGWDSYQFDLTDDRTALGLTNVFQYLQGKVPGLQITGNMGSTVLQWRGGSPTVYLDEMATDADMLATVSVNDIAYIKVFRPPFMGGFNGAGGAIAVYTKKGNDAASRPGAKSLDNALITGYTPIREFYSPDYGRYDARHEQRDLRTTLYWNPFVIMNARNRTVKLVFYNNDVTDAYRVIIEGVSKDGKLAHIETIVD